jgi:hypothetical protein
VNRKEFLFMNKDTRVGMRATASGFAHVQVEAFGHANGELFRQLEARSAGSHAASLPLPLDGVPGFAGSSASVHGFGHDLEEVSLTVDAINADLMPASYFYGMPKDYRRVRIRAGVRPFEGAGHAELRGRIRRTLGEVCLDKVDHVYLTEYALILSFDGIPDGPEDLARDAITRAKCEPMRSPGGQAGYRFGRVRGDRRVEVTGGDAQPLSVKLVFREHYVDRLAGNLWPDLDLSSLAQDLVATTLGDADLPSAFLRVASPAPGYLSPASARRNTPTWEIIRRACLEAVA